MADNRVDETSSNTQLRQIILDTNIFDLFSNQETLKHMLSLMQDAISKGYGFVISDMVMFELIQETSIEKEQKMLGYLAGRPSLPLTTDVMRAAAHLSCLYKDLGLDLKQFATGDRIIGAVAILNNAVILTKNGRDFPEPFFKEIAREHLDYKNGKVPACVYLYFKEPQLDVISKFHSIRTSPLKQEKRQKKD